MKSQLTFRSSWSLWAAGSDVWSIYNFPGHAPFCDIITPAFRNEREERVRVARPLSIHTLITSLTVYRATQYSQRSCARIYLSRTIRGTSVPTCSSKPHFLFKSSCVSNSECINNCRPATLVYPSPMYPKMIFISSPNPESRTSARELRVTAEHRTKIQNTTLFHSCTTLLLHTSSNIVALRINRQEWNYVGRFK